MSERERPSAAGSVMSTVLEEFSSSVARSHDCSFLGIRRQAGSKTSILLVNIIASMAGSRVPVPRMRQFPDSGSFLGVAGEILLKACSFQFSTFPDCRRISSSLGGPGPQ